MWCRVAVLRWCGAMQAIKNIEGSNPEQTLGIKIALRAMEEPLRQIVANTGHADPSVVLNKVVGLKGDNGYNAATDEFGDMGKFGILDPTKVVRSALQNAASIAGLMITTEAMIAEKVSDNANVPSTMGMDGMGMM